MFRFFRRALAVLVLLAALAALKHGCPAVRQTVSGWITGIPESPLVQAVSQLVRAVGEGEPVRDAVEVFCEDLRAGA